MMFCRVNGMGVTGTKEVEVLAFNVDINWILLSLFAAATRYQSADVDDGSASPRWQRRVTNMIKRKFNINSQDIITITKAVGLSAYSHGLGSYSWLTDLKLSMVSLYQLAKSGKCVEIDVRSLTLRNAY